MAVSKRLRFEVLRRDNHACHYCGASAPEVEITVDHVIPVALGGKDEASNLVAACRDCNGGKTSIAPDSPLVADVAQDALRWSQAMTVAAGKMLADTARVEAAYGQFDAWWSAWTCGPKKLPVPRPDDWRNSVDAFLGAGLPLDMLRWCVTRAMGSKASPDGTWRYMCGTAWAKVRELQNAARDSLQELAGDDQDDEWSPTETAARRNLACELLGSLTEEERESELSEMREILGGEDDVEVYAACAAFHSMAIDRRRLTGRLRYMLDHHPLGDTAIARARKDLESNVAQADGTAVLERAARLLAQDEQAAEVQT